MRVLGISTARTDRDNRCTCFTRQWRFQLPVVHSFTWAKRISNEPTSKREIVVFSTSSTSFSKQSLPHLGLGPYYQWKIIEELIRRVQVDMSDPSCRILENRWRAFMHNHQDRRFHTEIGSAGNFHTLLASNSVYLVQMMHFKLSSRIDPIHVSKSQSLDYCLCWSRVNQKYLLTAEPKLSAWSATNGITF